MGRLKKADRELAAVLVAEGRRTDEKIAEELKCSRQTLAVLKRKPDFKACVEALIQEHAAKAREHGIARLEHRLEVQQEAEEVLRTIMNDAASHSELKCRAAKGLMVVHQQTAKETGQFTESSKRAELNLAEQMAEGQERLQSYANAKALPIVTNSQKDTPKLVN